MPELGYTYTRELFVVHLQFQFNWEFCILSDKPVVTFKTPTLKIPTGSKRYVHPGVHSTTIHNSQDMETT